MLAITMSNTTVIPADVVEAIIALSFILRSSALLSSAVNKFLVGTHQVNILKFNLEGQHV